MVRTRPGDRRARCLLQRRAGLGRDPRRSPLRRLCEQNSDLGFGAASMKTDNFFAELKRRNVYKVAAAYAVVAWLLIQAASILFPTFEVPTWMIKVLVVVIVLGFPAALILSWAFEIT